MAWSRHPLLVLFQVVLVTGMAARGSAAELADPVVVIVDSPIGPGLDGDAVRQAVRDELGAPVVAPSDLQAAVAANILLVAADKGTIRLTLRAKNADVTTRTIVASPDRGKRLRDIAWLAGNLLRDQVSPILGVPFRGASRPVALAEPPRLTAQAKEVPAVDALAAHASPAPGSPRPQWAIAVLSGPAFAPNQEGNLYSSTVQVDVQRRAASGGLVLGVALQVGHNLAGDTVHAFGLDVFGGKEWRGPRGFGELTAGVGIEAARPLNGGAYNCGSPCSFTPLEPALAPTPFVRAAATAGVAITSRLDLAVRVSGEFSGDGILDSTASATAGLRLRAN